MMVSLNIPWKSLDNNMMWKNFLQKYIDKQIPDELTITKNYLDECYQEKLNIIRNDIGDQFIWCSLNEITDPLGNYMINLIVGKLDADGQPSTSHLLACKQLEIINGTSISRFINSSLRMLWPTTTNNGLLMMEEKVLLLVTEGAPYMLKATEQLQIFYPNIQHLTCMVYGLNKVMAMICIHFPNVNRLIETVNKIFFNSPYRLAKLKEYLGDIELPVAESTIITTKWYHHWLTTAIFHAEHFTAIKSVSNKFPLFSFHFIPPHIYTIFI